MSDFEVINAANVTYLKVLNLEQRQRNIETLSNNQLIIT